MLDTLHNTENGAAIEEGLMLEDLKRLGDV